VFAVADEGGADHDENDTDPAGGGNALTEKPDRGKGGEDEAQTGERPEETDVAFRHQHEEAEEEESFEEDAGKDLRTGGAGFGDAENLGSG